MIKRSGWMLGYLLSVHLVSAMVVILLPVTWWFKLVLLCVLVISLGFYCHKYQWLGDNRKAINDLHVDTNGYWFLTRQTVQLEQPHLLQRAVVFRYWMVLYLKPLNKREALPVVLLADSCDNKDWRWLNLKARELGAND